MLQNVSKYLLAQNKLVERLNGEDKVQPRINDSLNRVPVQALLAAGIAGVDGDLTVVEIRVYILSVGSCA